MDKDIVVMFPTEREGAFFAPRDGVRVVHCGVGMAECAAATARLLAEGRPDVVILAGITGSYSDRLAVGETVAVRSETVADMGRLSGGEFTPLFQKTYVASVVPEGYPTVASNTVNCAGALAEQPADAEIENMEGAAFLAVCASLGVPAIEIRTVSNRVGEAISAEDLQLSTKNLARELTEIVKRYL